MTGIHGLHAPCVQGGSAFSHLLNAGNGGGWNPGPLLYVW